MTFDDFKFKHGDVVHHKADPKARGVVIGRAIFQDEVGTEQKFYQVSTVIFGIVDALEIELQEAAT